MNTASRKYILVTRMSTLKVEPQCRIYCLLSKRIAAITCWNTSRFAIVPVVLLSAAVDNRGSKEDSFAKDGLNACTVRQPNHFLRQQTLRHPTSRQTPAQQIGFAIHIGLVILCNISRHHASNCPSESFALAQRSVGHESAELTPPPLPNEVSQSI